MKTGRFNWDFIDLTVGMSSFCGHSKAAALWRSDLSEAFRGGNVRSVESERSPPRCIPRGGLFRAWKPPVAVVVSAGGELHGPSAVSPKTRRPEWTRPAAFRAPAGFAVAHFYIKGTLSPGELHARQAAQGVEAQGRGPYGVEDFSEPKTK